MVGDVFGVFLRGSLSGEIDFSVFLLMCGFYDDFFGLGLVFFYRVPPGRNPRLELKQGKHHSNIACLLSAGL